MPNSRDTEIETSTFHDKCSYSGGHKIPKRASENFTTTTDTLTGSVVITLQRFGKIVFADFEKLASDFDH